MPFDGVPPDPLPGFGKASHALSTPVLKGPEVLALTETLRVREQNTRKFFRNMTAEVGALLLDKGNDPLKRDFSGQPLTLMIDNLPKSVRDVVLHHLERIGEHHNMIPQTFFPPKATSALRGALVRDIEEDRKRRDFIDMLFAEMARLAEYFALYQRVYERLRGVKKAVNEAIDKVDQAIETAEERGLSTEELKEKKERLKRVKARTKARKEELKQSHAPSRKRLREIDETLDKDLAQSQTAAASATPPSSRGPQRSLSPALSSSLPNNANARLSSTSAPTSTSTSTSAAGILQNGQGRKGTSVNKENKDDDSGGSGDNETAQTSNNAPVPEAS